jgi:HK97 family phage major capsid protein
MDNDKTKVDITVKEIKDIITEERKTIDTSIETKLTEANKQFATDINRIIDEKFLQQKKETTPAAITNGGIPSESGTNIRIVEKDLYPIGHMLRIIGNAQLLRKDVNEVMNLLQTPHEIRGMVASTVAGGGALVPEIISSELIPLLQAKSVVRAAGCPVVPMINGNFTTPKVKAGSTAYWRGEVGNATLTTPEVESLVLTSKYIVNQVAISDPLLRYAPGVDRMIQEDMIMSIKALEDYQYLIGVPTAQKPIGMATIAAKTSGNSNAMTGGGSPTAATRKTDLLKAVKALAKNKISMSNPAWFMSSQNYFDLLSQVDANSNPMDYARTLSENNRLFGYPVFWTTALSGTASNTIILSDLYYMRIAQALNLRIRFTEWGSYISGGVTISGNVTNEHVFTGELEVDFGAKYDAACAAITGVTWGY